MHDLADLARGRLFSGRAYTCKKSYDLYANFVYNSARWGNCVEIMQTQLEIGTIVAGRVCGHFVILGFRMIDGEQYAQLKEVGRDGQTLPGEFALPCADLIF